MTGIAGWFFAYLFFMALGAWIGALMGRTAEEQLFVFLLVSVFSLWIIGAAARRRR